MFNRFFLMGFYGFCLSLVLYWSILGFCLRRRESFRLRDVAVLTVVFLGAYFTHLVGFLLAAASATWLVAMQPRRSWRKQGLLAVALAPAGWLATRYLGGVSFIQSQEATDLSTTIASRLCGSDALDQFEAALGAINAQLFEPYETAYVPLGVLFLLCFQAIVIGTALAPPLTQEEKTLAPRRWPVALLALGLAVLYFLVPEHFGTQGGFLRSRLVVVVPMLCVACLILPGGIKVRWAFRAVIASLIGLNLVLVCRHLLAANRELKEFTAGAVRVGSNRTLIFYRPGASSQIS